MDSEEQFWNDSKNVLDTLSSDLDILHKQLKINDQQVWRRAYYRAVFALIESQIFYLKNYVLTFPEGGIDEETELSLRDQKVIHRQDGEKRTITSFKSFQDNVVFSLETFAWFYGIEYQVIREDAGWKDLVISSHIRNRIVHPKTPENLIISDNEMLGLDNARSWFFQQMAILYKKHLRNEVILSRNLKKWLKSNTASNASHISHDTET